MSSIVKVFVVSSPPSLVNPWQNRMQKQGTGTGFIIDVNTSVGDRGAQRCILTNAHVVTHSTFVEVRRHGSSVRYNARVVAEGHDCDMAVLHVEDESFWSEGGGGVQRGGAGGGKRGALQLAGGNDVSSNTTALAGDGGGSGPRGGAHGRHRRHCRWAGGLRVVLWVPHLELM